MKIDIKTKEQLDRMRVACRMSAEVRDLCAHALGIVVLADDVTL